MRSEIVVEDAREIGAFLRLTPAEGGWRVVVVDGADEMNRSAANALLKILEEPPQRALLVLVAHSPGRLLPTIRSRCRRLSLEPLVPDIVGELISRYRPDLGLAERAAIIALAGGSIGRALELAAVDGIELYRSILTLLSGRTGLDTPALHDFADRVARAEAAESYRTVEELIGHFLENLAMAAAGRNAELALPGEETILRRLSACAPAERWAALRHEIGANFARSNALNLDRKQSILSAFFAIERAAG
jgi:DNA polymerase-3 subunit delta'